MNHFDVTAAPTAMMAGLGLTFGDLLDYARHAVNLLQTVGSNAIVVLEQGFKLWQGISGRDLSKIISALTVGKENVAIIIDAIKAEFGL